MSERSKLIFKLVPCHVIVFFHFVVPMTWVAISSAGVALLVALDFLFFGLFSLFNLHLLLARPSGLDIPSEAHVSAAVADVPRPIQDQVDAVRGSETDHQLAIQMLQPRWRRPLAPTGKDERHP